MKKKSYFITGLKALAISFLSNFILVILLTFISVSNLLKSNMGIIIGLVMILVLVFLGIYINGLLSHKLWGWDE